MTEIKAVPDSILQTLTAHGQLHLLTGWDTLSPQARRAFCAALERLDYTHLAAPSLSIPLDFARIAPLAAMELPAISQVREACMDTGLTALQNGEVGAVILAGGLNPDNVTRAIQTVHPFAVDANTALRPFGELDRKTAAAFVRNAHLCAEPDIP